MKEAESSRDLAEIQLLATESSARQQRAISAVPRGEGCVLPSRLHRAQSLAPAARAKQESSEG